MERTRKIVWLSMLVFSVCMASCFALEPRWTTFSRYGTLEETFPLFAASMMAVAVTLWVFGLFVRVHLKSLGKAAALRVCAVIVVALILLPYTAGPIIRNFHNSLAAVMAVIFLTVSISIARQQTGRNLWPFVSLQFVGFLIGVGCFMFLLRTPSPLWGIFEPLFCVGACGFMLKTMQLTHHEEA
ncbi:hypothetical protein IPL68_00045 [Candidatus Saccharibacteria bacterium]|nr:MAG: hypothetical protein IPL68_00045 [Candidatus Saccharibacteria bacterium]